MDDDWGYPYDSGNHQIDVSIAWKNGTRWLLALVLNVGNGGMIY